MEVDEGIGVNVRVEEVTSRMDVAVNDDAILVLEETSKDEVNTNEAATVVNSDITV